MRLSGERTKAFHFYSFFVLLSHQLLVRLYLHNLVTFGDRNDLKEVLSGQVIVGILLLVNCQCSCISCLFARAARQMRGVYRAR